LSQVKSTKLTNKTVYHIPVVVMLHAIVLVVFFEGTFQEENVRKSVDEAGKDQTVGAIYLNISELEFHTVNERTSA
jgi:hypothetical protein